MQNKRKPLGVLILLAFLAAWVWAAVSLAPAPGAWPFLGELMYYLAAGTLWAIPLRPLFLWMNAGEPPEED